jgi:site-specific DNA recombinase
MNTEDLLEILLDIKSNWNQLDALEKKMLLQMFTKKILVDRVSDQLKPDCLEIKEVEFY